MWGRRRCSYHFNRAKSNLRVLEYWTAGYPVIASPVLPYKFINDGKDGILAMEKYEWFNALENLFIKYHPVSPNRIINLNKYWIGRWYPFSDNNGFIEDPKTVVTVGSLISLMAGTLFKLDKFRINNTLLKTKLISNIWHSTKFTHFKYLNL